MADSGGFGQNPATLTILGALMASPLLLKLSDHLFGWRKNKAEAQAKIIDSDAKIKELANAQLEMLLSADAARMTQMSEALAEQSRQIAEQSRQMAEQSRQIAELSAQSADQSKKMDRMISHIENLEAIMKAKKIPVPSRPAFEMVD